MFHRETTCVFWTFLKVQSTPDNSNLQGKLNKVRVSGSSEQMAGIKGEKLYLLRISIHKVYIVIKFNNREVD